MPQDSVKTQHGIIEEATWGTTPASAIQRVNLQEYPDFSLQRNTGRPDTVGGTNPRRGYAERSLQETGNLTLNAGLQFANMRLLWEAALMNDQGADVSIDVATITATSSTGVLADSGSGLGSISVGDMIYIAGADWTGAGNSAGWYGPVSAAAAGSITIPAAQFSNDTTPSTSTTIDTRPLLDGDTPRSFSFESEHEDLTTDFRNGTGYKVQSHTWSWATNDFARESCSLVGQSPAQATATIGTGGPTAAPVSDFMDCVTNFGSIYIDETATTYIVQNWELVVNVELGPYYGLGNLGPSGISEARILPEFNATIFYDDNAKALLANIEDLTTLSAFWDVVDAQGNRVCWHLPAMRAVTGDPGGGAPGTQMEFRNLRLVAHDPEKDSTSSYFSSSFDYQIGIYEAAA